MCTFTPLNENSDWVGSHSTGYALPLPSKSASESFRPVDAAFALKWDPRFTGTDVCDFTRGNKAASMQMNMVPST